MSLRVDMQCVENVADHLKAERVQSVSLNANLYRPRLLPAGIPVLTKLRLTLPAAELTCPCRCIEYSSSEIMPCRISKSLPCSIVSKQVCTSTLTK
jgi:hypothetical protein